MVRTVTSAQRKLARGVEHVKTLRAEAATFADAEAYEFVVERERCSPKEVKYHCFAVEHQPPPDHWPVLTGEVVQNLRSALDHAVWSAWKDAGNEGGGDHTMFPIAINPDGFASQAGRYLPGVSADIRALIEEAQPYRCYAASSRP